MMHILAVTIFLGAFALSMAVIGWMIAGNRTKILAALAGHPVAEAPAVEVAAPVYARRNQRFRVTYVNLFSFPATPARRLAA